MADNNNSHPLDDRMDGQPKQSYLFDHLYVLFKRRKVIVLSILLTGVLTTGIVLLMPNWYAATASVLPPKRPGGLLSMLEGSASTLFKNLAGLGVRLGGSSDAYSYIAILESRSAMERVVQKFDLVRVYKSRKNSVEEAIRTLRENVEFNIATEGNITITVYDKSPQRAADMANYFVKLLNEISRELGTTEARNNREFIEKRYRQNVEDLRRAEDSLKAFQQKYGIYALPQQTESAIKAAAELKSAQVQKQMEFDIARRMFGAENPRTQALQLELMELNRRLSEIKYGTDDWFQQSSLNFFVPFKDVPELGTEYLRRFREFEIQNRLMEFLLPLYEQAKIDENKDTPVVLVLDHAVPPERKSRPHRTLIILIFVFLAAMFSTTWAFIREIYEREKERNWKVGAMAEELRHGSLYRKLLGATASEEKGQHGL
ncbi:MAG: Wzz/FepE/Etk N-terminal domain-containing protein [candidate division KSB1 bacterium]|nr:Wzz/FepE/Etk N-terminal domain-containing protein [candidate division KSB1 bacterium]MDZ7274360.1 Wzz/FepE/Etk N-terminal domain-containing protein [candidate division KSB1 bacterium]MDZ7284978.1 Wzz/FepE/Etk N-terminal domain-containing protein [candidate division KSB1 bacterium]MDZ7297601.1 Wzz/FepE/Etk N-terminal domain-containing protein [candidate division KSB1 bacterium]MDZ7306341.1 Wzz/FepE/Etk N-terminal domain-containing protein [candidate division KSB1 bacterium]